MCRVPAAFLVFAIVLACVAQTGCTELLRQLERTSAGMQSTEACRAQAAGSHLKEALRACDTAVAMAPTYPLAYFYRAVVEFELGQTSKELDDLDQAIRLDATLAQAYAMRCMALLDVPGDNASIASSDCDEAVRLAPKNEYVLGTRYQFRLDTKDYSGALSDATAIVTLAPNHSSGYGDEAYVYMRLHRPADAKRLAHRAEAASGNGGDDYAGLGVLETELADWSHAVADADRSIAQAPSSVAYNNRCWIRIRTNDIAGARSDCARSLALDPNQPNTLDTRGDLRFRLRDYRGVLADEQPLIDQFPRSPIGFGNRCEAETALKLLRAAMRDCQKAIDLDRTNNGEWYVFRGNIYRARGLVKLARGDYELAQSLDPSAVDALREEALLELQQFDATHAADVAARYVGTNPYDPVGHEVYGRALASKGNTAAARSEYAAAIAGYKKRSDTVGMQAISSQLALLGSAAHH